MPPIQTRRQRTDRTRTERGADPHVPTNSNATNAAANSVTNASTAHTGRDESTDQRRRTRTLVGDDTASMTRPPSRAGLKPINMRLEARDERKHTMHKDPLRAHVLVDNQRVQVPFEETFASRPAKAPGRYESVTEHEVDAAFTKATKQRSKAIADLASVDVVTTASVTPEDGSRRIAAYHMGFGAMDQAGERFIEQLADIGRVEGFRVVVRVGKGNEKYLSKLLDAEEERNVTYVLAETYHDIWSEDAGEVRSDRSISVPASMPEGMSAPAEILKARIARFTKKRPPDTDDTAKLFEFLKQHAPDACFGVLGMVFERGHALLCVALSSGQPLRVSLSAIEGGNMLVGTNKAGEPVAFVGKDSFELTRRVLERETGKPIDDVTLRKVVASDLGVPPERVHAIEQPGDYHLDVKMLPIAPGEMIVNDSIAAAIAQEEWLRDDHAAQKSKERPEDWKRDGVELEKRIKALHEAAKIHAKGEAMAQRDLEAAGVKVHRVAAVFPWAGSVAPMNFLNAEQGRGKDGKRFFIALGGEPRGERLFLNALKKIVGGRGDVDIARVYFLDRGLTHATLQAGGGVNCRAKPEQAV